MQPVKIESEAIEDRCAEDVPPGTKGGMLVMRSQEDDLSIWQSVRRYWRVGYIAMLAAFSASLDGYREAPATHLQMVCGS